jgi:hypothetical protein
VAACCGVSALEPGWERWNSHSALLVDRLDFRRGQPAGDCRVPPGQGGGGYYHLPVLVAHVSEQQVVRRPEHGEEDAQDPDGGPPPPAAGSARLVAEHLAPVAVLPPGVIGRDGLLLGCVHARPSSSRIPRGMLLSRMPWNQRAGSSSAARVALPTGGRDACPQ